MIKVGLLGDSVGRGVVQDNTSGKYVVSKQSFANLCQEKFDILVENFARFGSTVMNGMTSFNRFFDELKTTNYVLMIFGGNDCNFDWDAISENPSLPHKPACPVEEFKQKYTDLIHQVQAQGESPVLLSLPPIAAHKFYHFICRNRNAENILKYLGGNINNINNWHEMYNLAVFHVGAHQGIPVLDITSPFFALRDYESYFCDDGMHPNESGHKLIADTLQKRLENVFNSIDAWKHTIEVK